MQNFNFFVRRSPGCSFLARKNLNLRDPGEKEVQEDKSEFTGAKDKSPIPDKSGNTGESNLF